MHTLYISTGIKNIDGIYCRQKVTRTVDTGAGFFLEEEDEEETRSKKTEVKHPLGEVKVTSIEGQGHFFKKKTEVKYPLG